MVEKSNILDINVKTHSNDPNSVVVGSFFNGLNVPSTTEFQVYKHKKRSHDLLIHGENDTLQYNGETSKEDQKYCVGVYDPETKTLELVNASLIPGTVTSKIKRHSKRPAVKSLTVQRNIQRNQLGEEFGTKKAKKAIADLERNKIDATKLEDDQIDIVAGIKSNTKTLPTAEEMVKSLDENRIIPDFDLEATNVADIYPLENVIPKRELQSIRIDFLMDDTTEVNDKLNSLPYTSSVYLLKKLSMINSNTANQKLKLQIVYFISCLMGLYSNRRSHHKDKLIEAYTNAPSNLIIDHLLANFTTLKKNKKSFTIDPKNEDKILSYMLCLILKLDEYQAEVSPLATELSLKPSRLVSLFKSLGCQIKNITVAQAEGMGLPKSSVSGGYKISSLKVPFKAPEVARRRVGGR